MQLTDPKPLTPSQEARLLASQKSEKQLMLDITIPAITKAGGQYRGSEGTINGEMLYEYHAHFEKGGKSLRLRAGQRDLKMAEPGLVYKPAKRSAYGE